MSQATDGFVMNQTMLRIKDPQKSVQFYTDVLGMTLLDRYNFDAMKFSLYFLGYPDATDDQQHPVTRLWTRLWQPQPCLKRPIGAGRKP